MTVATQTLAGALIALVGLSVGSFLNVLIARLPLGERLTGRSRCPHCRAQIVWWQNIPVFSYLFLLGKCARCRRRISWQYPAIEIATASLFLLAAQPLLSRGVDALPVVLRDCVFIAVLLVVFAIDWRHYVILDIVTLPAAGLALAFNLFLGQPWEELLLGGILGAGFFSAQYVISRGRWIGDGDIRLGLLLGLLLGWPGLIVALMLSYFVGAAVGVALLAAGMKRLGSKLPLGTFLAAGGITALLYGEPIIAWYVRQIGW